MLKYTRLINTEFNYFKRTNINFYNETFILSCLFQISFNLKSHVEGGTCYEFSTIKDISQNIISIKYSLHPQHQFKTKKKSYTYRLLVMLFLKSKSKENCMFKRCSKDKFNNVWYFLKKISIIYNFY